MPKDVEINVPAGTTIRRSRWGDCEVVISDDLAIVVRPLDPGVVYIRHTGDPLLGPVALSDVPRMIASLGVAADIARSISG